MVAKRNLFAILALAFLCPLFASCGNGQANTSSCDYPAEITIGNSNKTLPSGSCSGEFASATAASVRMSVGQTLMVRFGERGVASARSLDSKTLELTAESPVEQRYQAIASGASEILYSPPAGGLLVCSDGVTISSPCVIAKVTVFQSCPGSTSAGKCNSLQNRPTTVSTVNAGQIQPGHVALKAQQSPLPVMCGPNFFAKVQAQLLTQQFGAIECFRFSGKDQWVVIGNGRAESSVSTGSPLSPGGVIVATEKCARSDTTCLSSAAVHDFANFTVYYPPHPLIDLPGGISATSYGNLLSINDGKGCMHITFNMANGHWYPMSASDKLLETNPGAVPSLNTLLPVSGARALTQPAPPATLWSC